jgi:FixJ family two-component response regulator
MTPRRRLIALVDDNARVRGTYQMLLRKRGFDCINFASAEGFLQSSRSHEADCLLLDVWMPGMSGIELQKHLAVAGLRIPIIILTGDPDETIEAVAREAGALRFLAKDAPPDVLIAAVTEVLAAGAA